MNVRAFICDFDGTVNDSFNEGLRRLEVLSKINGMPFTHTQHRKLIECWGLPGVQLLVNAFGISEDKAKHMYTQWEVFDETLLVPLIRGARETLSFNRLHGIVNVLLTSRNRDNLFSVLDRHGIRSSFVLTQALQDWPIRKPDPRAFEYILSRLATEHGIDKHECVFMGDTSADIEAGQKAGIETLVVLTGPYWLHSQRTPVEQSNILPSIEGWPEWYVVNGNGATS